LASFPHSSLLTGLPPCFSTQRSNSAAVIPAVSETRGVFSDAAPAL
jgi:hypothetical protein